MRSFAYLNFIKKNGLLLTIIDLWLLLQFSSSQYCFTGIVTLLLSIEDTFLNQCMSKTVNYLLYHAFLIARVSKRAYPTTTDSLAYLISRLSPPPLFFRFSFFFSICLVSLPFAIHRKDCERVTKMRKRILF